jgi:hypothetical protein
MTVHAYFKLMERAWEIYCKETAGDMHVVDYWVQLSPDVQEIYLKKAKEELNNG